jgi:hypothetical protein
MDRPRMSRIFDHLGHRTLTRASLLRPRAALDAGRRRASPRSSSREADPSAPFVRRDFSESGWNGHARPSGVIAFWKSTVAPPDQKRRGFVDDQTLLDLFERLGGDEPAPPRPVPLRSQALLSWCGRNSVRGVAAPQLREVWRRGGCCRRARPEARRRSRSLNPKLDDDAMKEVADQLGEVLHGAW